MSKHMHICILRLYKFPIHPDIISTSHLYTGFILLTKYLNFYTCASRDLNPGYGLGKAESYQARLLAHALGILFKFNIFLLFIKHHEVCLFSAGTNLCSQPRICTAVPWQGILSL